MPFTTALFAMDSANGIFQNVFARDGGFGRDTMGGGGDMLAIPDLTTFRVLPWAHKCGWVLSDLYLKSGERCPLDPRLVMQTACDRLARQGLIYVGGVEVECHILKITDERNNLADCTSLQHRSALRRCATAINTCRRTALTNWSRSSRRFAKH